MHISKTAWSTQPRNPKGLLESQHSMTREQRVLQCVYRWFVKFGLQNARSLTKRKLQVADVVPLFSVSGSLFQDTEFQMKTITPVLLSARQDSLGRDSWWSSLLNPFPLSGVINLETMNLLIDSLKTCHRLLPPAKSQVLCAIPTPFLQCYTPISLFLCLNNSLAGLCASWRFGSHAQEARILLRSSF